MSQINEYNSLRQELLKDQDRQLTIINFSLTATAAFFILLGEGHIQESLIFLVPLPVLTAALFQIRNILYSSLIKAVHIRIIIESQIPDIKWETYISQYRKRLRREKSKRALFFKKGRYLLLDVFPYLLLMIFLGGVCVFMAICLANDNWKRLFSMAIGGLWLIISCFILMETQFAISGQYEENLEKKWIDIEIESPR